MVTQSQKQTSSQTRRKSGDKPNKVTMWSCVASFNREEPAPPSSQDLQGSYPFPCG